MVGGKTMAASANNCRQSNIRDPCELSKMTE
jgi:hypothetical protein